MMKSGLAGATMIAVLVMLSGCQQADRPIGADGRPNVPVEQTVPGGPMSKGPVGQPQA